MCNLKPLKSSVGQPAEGEDKYFHREKIVNKILRKLDNGENILLSAPRRIGKSSILKHIKNNPQEGQIIKYLIVQSVDSSEEFFKKLYNELINDDEIFEGIEGYLKRTTGIVRHYLGRLTGISTEGFDVSPNDNINYYQECLDLMEFFKNKKVVIFIDEFPDALNNILKKDKDLAISFLQENRDIRQQFSNTNLQFVYTGSTGLRNIVKNLGHLDLINDINEVHIPPFTEHEAIELIKRLVLGCQTYEKDFTVDDASISHILQKVTWRLPYYLQVIVAELFEYYEDHNKPITIETVDWVLDEMVKAKSNHSDYFDNWKRRLHRSFKKDEYGLSIAILSHIAKHDSITSGEIKELAKQCPNTKINHILSILEYDGYISEDQHAYGFNSFLLKEW